MKVLTFYPSGFAEYIGNECMCTHRVYCDIKGTTMCADDYESNGNSMCTSCDQDP